MSAAKRGPGLWEKAQAAADDSETGWDKLEAERDRYRAALEECCRVSGADLSDGFPTWPELPEFAVQCVQMLRIDADDTADLDRADRYANALQQIAQRTTNIPPSDPVARDVCALACEALEGV